MGPPANRTGDEQVPIVATFSKVWLKSMFQWKQKLQQAAERLACITGIGL